MKEQNTFVTYTRSEIDTLPDETDWERVDALTDEDIDAAASSDPDAPPTDASFWKDATVVMPENMMDLSTPFDESKILDYACQYPLEHDDSVEGIKCHVINQGYLSLSDLKVVGKWKVKQERNTLPNIIKNSEALVIDITRIALSSDNVPVIGLSHLQCLRGVGPAVASAILHWFHEDPYPIWDKFARTALGFNPVQNYCKVKDWKDYTSRFRGIMEHRNVDKRTLDRALWVSGNPKCENIR